MPSYSDIYAEWGLPNLGPQGQSTGNHVLNSLKGSFWEYYENQSDALKKHRFQETVKGANNWITSGNLRGENYIGQPITVSLPTKPIELAGPAMASARPTPYVAPPSPYGYWSPSPASFGVMPPPKQPTYRPPNTAGANPPRAVPPNTPTPTAQPNTGLFGGAIAPTAPPPIAAQTPQAPTAPTATNAMLASRQLWNAPLMGGSSLPNLTTANKTSLAWQPPNVSNAIGSLMQPGAGMNLWNWKPPKGNNLFRQQ